MVGWVGKVEIRWALRSTAGVCVTEEQDSVGWENGKPSVKADRFGGKICSGVLSQPHIPHPHVVWTRVGEGSLLRNGEICSGGSSCSLETFIPSPAHSQAEAHTLILSYSLLTFLHVLFCPSLSCMLFTYWNYKHFKTKNKHFFPFVRLWHTYFCWYITWRSAKQNW